MLTLTTIAHKHNIDLQEINECLISQRSSNHIKILEKYGNDRALILTLRIDNTYYGYYSDNAFTFLEALDYPSILDWLLLWDDSELYDLMRAYLLIYS